MDLTEIKTFAERNFALPENKRFTIEVDGIALANPWMDKSGRFELSDRDAVEEWGMEAVLKFCDAVSAHIHPTKHTGITKSSAEQVSGYLVKCEGPINRGKTYICEKVFWVNASCENGVLLGPFREVDGASVQRVL